MLIKILESFKSQKEVTTLWEAKIEPLFSKLCWKMDANAGIQNSF